MASLLLSSPAQSQAPLVPSLSLFCSAYYLFSFPLSCTNPPLGGLQVWKPETFAFATPWHGMPLRGSVWESLPLRGRACHSVAAYGKACHSVAGHATPWQGMGKRAIPWQGTPLRGRVWEGLPFRGRACHSAARYATPWHSILTFQTDMECV